MDFQKNQELFLLALSLLPPESFASQLHLKEMGAISFAMDLCPLQDSFRFRARYLGWRIADFLVGETGELDGGRLEKLCGQFENGLFPTGPKMEGDGVLYSHISHCLHLLRDERKMGVMLKKFSIPLCHKGAEEIIRETLWPEEIGKVQTHHVRRAVLAAWFTPLRQATGSCFATAPAILFQQDPELFFKDLDELLNTGQLRKVMGGRGYAVPLSPAAGQGDLHKSLSSFPSLEILAYAPGLRIAMEGVSLPDLRAQLSTVDETVKTPEELIKSLLLKSFDLTEEMIGEEEHLEKIQMTPLMAKQGFVHYQKPSERGKKVGEFKKRLAKALVSFRALTESALLRAWEYSLASLSDVKFDFARWNLCIGLGLNHEQKGGIADFLFQFIDAKLAVCNEQAVKLHDEYEQVISQATALEVLFHRSTNEDQRRQLKGEWTGAIHSADTILGMRDQAAAKGEALSQSFSEFIRQYYEKLQDHFQEIFDPSVVERGAEIYEDSPAGFRLVYKHGRMDASLWTRIHTEEEYLKALRDFFSMIEPGLQTKEPLGTEFVSEVTTEIIRYLQRPEFITSAKERSKQEGRLSPWHYVSGGTMQVLLQNYFSREKPLTEFSFVPHSPEELFLFLKQSEGGSLLIHSPSHAFILKPEWIDPHAEVNIEKSRQKVKEWTLDFGMQEWIAHRLKEKLHPLEQPLFLHLFRQQPAADSNALFRSCLLESLQKVPGSRLKNPIAVVDSLLYEHFLLLPSAEAKRALSSLLHPWSIDASEVDFEGEYVTSGELQQKAKERILQGKNVPFSSRDLSGDLAEVARRQGLSYPGPVFFADTNWAGWLFGWIVNPVTVKLELWRLNRTATQGAPMIEWSEYLSLQNRFPWVVLPKREEYTRE